MGATGALVIPPGSCLPAMIACDIRSSRAPFRPETQKVCPAAVTSMAPASAEWVEEDRASGWEGDSASRESMSSSGCLMPDKEADRQTDSRRATLPELRAGPRAGVPDQSHGRPAGLRPRAPSLGQVSSPVPCRRAGTEPSRGRASRAPHPDAASHTPLPPGQGDDPCVDGQGN